MARVAGLGHVGIYVRDLDKMVAFYRDFLGMQVTKQNPTRGMVFLSSDPVASDHEIALMRGRPENDDPHLIDQISLRVETLDDLRDFHRRVQAEQFKIDRVVNHGSGLGCYFFDPEGNRTEVFWRTGRDCWQPTGEPIDLTQSDEAILAEIDKGVERNRDVPVGGIKEPVAAPARG
jgi:catechol-2,3-dioxygenase